MIGGIQETVSTIMKAVDGDWTPRRAATQSLRSAVEVACSVGLKPEDLHLTTAATIQAIIERGHLKPTKSSLGRAIAEMSCLADLLGEDSRMLSFGAMEEMLQMGTEGLQKEQAYYHQLEMSLAPPPEEPKPLSNPAPNGDFSIEVNTGTIIT